MNLAVSQKPSHNVLTNVITKVNPMATRTEQYSGKVTPVGNSKGIRLDAAFFKTHPEFNGDVRATILGEGQVLLSAKTVLRSQEDEEDPVLQSFLQFLEKELADHPEQITAADEKQLARIKKLVDGVETD